MMLNKMPMFVLLVALSLTAAAVPASAQGGADAVVEQGRAAGEVGEQADGYIGLVKPSVSAELKAHVNQINIKRKAFYTDLASKRGVSVNEVGGATACELFKSRVADGQYYRDETGTWHQRSGAVTMPGFCPQ